MHMIIISYYQGRIQYHSYGLPQYKLHVDCNSNLCAIFESIPSTRNQLLNQHRVVLFDDDDGHRARFAIPGG
jgi:hypothetical protein